MKRVSLGTPWSCAPPNGSSSPTVGIVDMAQWQKDTVSHDSGKMERIWLIITLVGNALVDIKSELSFQYQTTARLFLYARVRQK